MMFVYVAAWVRIQAAQIKPQRRHQEFSVFLRVMRHLFVFICDEIEPTTLVTRRSEQSG
jgi:hypothetical protein